MFRSTAAPISFVVMVPPMSRVRAPCERAAATARSTAAASGITATVTVELRLSCLAITTPKRTGTVTVNGKTHEFTTPQIRITVNAEQDLLLAKMTFEVELDEDDPAIELSAEWNFDQIYHGTEIDTVELSDRVVILELTDDPPAATTAKQKELLPTPTEE